MKKILTLVLLFIIGVTIPLGCSGTQNNAVDNGTQGNGEQAQVLNVYNWSTYIDPEVITQFEEKFDVTVQYDTFESNEALLAKIQPGNPGYDIIVPTGDYIQNMAAQGLLEELNHDNIPNLENVDEAFLDPPFDPGNQYSIPYQWGTIGIGYNIEATGGEITSWGEIFDEEYAGRVALMEDPRATLGVILMYLGYSPNTTNSEELEDSGVAWRVRNAASSSSMKLPAGWLAGSRCAS
ncbi:MAG: spermidine/putrescine ABC transporter substrate-binding protein, partial [Kamptonema sp. SIO4C4]|nr:spermidine/putrescine ABC transporter substrate-binding protein [Kamptonema sp. SIO4C4]